MRHRRSQPVGGSGNVLVKSVNGNAYSVLDEKMHVSDVDSVRQLLVAHSAPIARSALEVADEAVNDIRSRSHIVAVLPWAELTPEALEDAPTQSASLPSSIRVGSLHSEELSAGSLYPALPHTRPSPQGGITGTLAESIHEGTLKHVNSGANPASLQRGLKKISDAICAEIVANSIKLTDSAEVAQVAAHAAKGNKIIGQIITDAMQKVGVDGSISIEESDTVETTLDIVEGMHFSEGYLSKEFVNNTETEEVILHNAYILILDQKIENPEAIENLLREVADSKRPLLIVAEDPSNEVVSILASSKLHGAIQLCATKAPYTGRRRTEFLEDIATVTGGKRISNETHSSLGSLTLSDLGRAGRVVVDETFTFVIDGVCNTAELQARIADIRKQIDDADSLGDREELQKRLAKLAGGVALIRAGGRTPKEKKEKKALLEIALAAARAAVEEGVVPGFGSALVHAGQALDSLNLSADEAVCADIIKHSIEVPLTLMAGDAGLDGNSIIKELKGRSACEGFNFATGAYEDLIKAGALEPSKSVRAALQDAVSTCIAQMPASTPELDKAAPAHASEMAEISFPALLPISKRKGLFFQSPKGGGAKSETLLQSVALRALCSLPVGCAQVHLVDLQTKGRAFASLSGLDPKLAPPTPITALELTALLKDFEKRIAEVNRRCLNRHEWLCDYNTANPDEPEPYHFICISDFPIGLEKEGLEAIDRLLAHECAARAGMYLLFSSEQPLPKSGNFANIPIVYTEGAKAELEDVDINTSSGGEFAGLLLVPDSLPAQIGGLVDRLNQAAVAKPKAKKVLLEVDSSKVWSGVAANGISVPIGKIGRQDMIFRLGNDASVHHALIGGATGKGKTVLLHNIILNAADLYSPEDLQMILMDFKEGTEFACYEGLPHMRVLSVASELHFGLGVFEWLVAERMRRAKLFKKVGVGNLADYIKASGEKLPRILVLMDEFQRLLSDGSIGPQVALLLDDLVRTGRSFGINLVLSTQSLANVNIEASTLEQLGLRICLELSEQEASRFLGYDNVVPASFNRPGQALYNESQGRREGNVEFQVAFVEAGKIPDRCIALRTKENDQYGRRVVKEARVFHGEQPVNPEGRVPDEASDKMQAFVGEPLKIQADPVAVVLDRSDGGNLICLGQSLEILNTVSCNLAAQFARSVREPEVYVADALPLAKERWSELLNESIRFVETPVALSDLLDQLCLELDERKLSEDSGSTVSKILFIVEPQLNKSFPLSNGMDTSPCANKVNTLLEQGPRFGIHIALITSRLSRTDKVLGPYGNNINLQYFANRIVFRSDEADRLLGFGAPIKNIGEFSGVVLDEAVGEAIPFQVYDTIYNEPI